MSAPVPGADPETWPNPGGRLGAVAPVPFVGVAAILVALIIFTPVLLSTGPSPLAVQAELVVYRAVGSPTTEFAVHGYDPDVAYAWVNLSVGTGFVWNGSCPAVSRLSWSTTNETDEVTANAVVSTVPVVLNATATYLGTAGRTVFAGELAFDVLNLGLTSESLAVAVCPWTSKVTAVSSWGVSGGALVIGLANYGSGGPP